MILQASRPQQRHQPHYDWQARERARKLHQHQGIPIYLHGGVSEEEVKVSSVTKLKVYASGGRQASVGSTI